ncbi:hypothetical protein F5X68DRAFT_78976 [Plectosphaerella plurivora]|uniref:Uncharacterized protein n=1 Tax=Plectosphaerella plurivora TaxID=936078 RepID=A0A9P9ACJ1_9PEZI|nr:hypothetical protein F5X68DRAFT_78976 [Plectosphaerella plurivora]
MSGREGASARLRKTFHYPADDDSDSQPDAIDEQEQESLIRRLSEENTSRNATFRLALLPVPILTIIPYLLRGTLSSRTLLALTSLLATFYLVYSQPPENTGFPLLDRLVQPARSRSEAALRAQRQKAAPFLPAEDSPLAQYLPYLNLLLCAFVMLAGWAAGSTDAHYGWIGLGNLPALIYAIVVGAKMIMGSVDPEGELGGLKYDYKGA